jgi:AbrB family looped-hinge helix DNA binding protein
MYNTVTLSSKGQITIPKSIRERLRLKPGDRINFVVRGDTVSLEPAAGSILEWYGALPVDAPQDLKAVHEQTMNYVAAETAAEGLPQGEADRG